MPLAVLTPAERAAYTDIRDRMTFHASRLPADSLVGRALQVAADTLAVELPPGETAETVKEAIDALECEF